MDDQQSPAPKIVFVEPPEIQLHVITGDQLDRIKEASTQVNHDLSFAIGAFSVGATLLTTYVSVPELTDRQQGVFLILTAVCVVVFLYTGIRWLRRRETAAGIIDAIRQPDQPK